MLSGIIGNEWYRNIVTEELDFSPDELFNRDRYILENSEPNIRTNIRRLIMIYDYLKWGKKEFSNSSICKQTPYREPL